MAQLKRMLVEAEERMVEKEQWWKKQEMRQVEREMVGERKQILDGVSRLVLELKVSRLDKSF